ncbi:AraC family transcriptional regulator [Pendulispora brunnea]|uniref:AraC family transcriptional regulator n=1 Tax=Pendulispora brunnea TaxID=2905690 RepID=A0ABZ2K2B6_9BACT
MLIRSPFLPLLFESMRANGHEAIADGIQRELELPAPTAGLVSEMTVPLPTFRAAVSLAAERLGDECLGLHLAQRVPHGSYGLLEYAARNAPDVGEVLNRIARYLPLVSDTTRIELRKLEQECSLVHFVPEEPGAMGRHANEFSLAIILRVVREASQVAVSARRVEFAHSAPADITELERFFGTSNIVFDAGHNLLAFEERTLSLPINGSDRALLPWLDSYAATMLPHESALAARIPGLHEQIRLCLQTKEAPTLAEVARRMQLSGRTLQRRLQDARTSFQDVLDAVRRELAESYLSDPKLTVYEIALLLGYSHRSGFERAFMKWCGTTPREFRLRRARAS